MIVDTFSPCGSTEKLYSAHGRVGATVAFKKASNRFTGNSILKTPMNPYEPVSNNATVDHIGGKLLKANFSKKPAKKNF